MKRIGALLTLLFATAACQATPARPPTDAGLDAGCAAKLFGCAPDAGPRDSGAPDSGMADSGAPDAGGPDSGVADAGLADAGPSDAGFSEPDAGPAIALPALPLHTQSRWIVDAQGARFKLASVNWYGAEELDHVVAGLDRASLPDIARRIRALGFNSVRIPWSNEMLELNPVVPDSALAANPWLHGMHALDVLDRVIAALAHEGLVVVLDNHTSRADWCCSVQDGNGLWYTDAYPEASWLADWRAMAQRYAHQPAVVAADLRNELRPVVDAACLAQHPGADCGTCPCTSPGWANDDPATDWRAAAERGGNAVLGVNPDLLVIVEGINYATDLTGAYSAPIQLSVANRLVYSPHDYAWDHPGLSSYDQLHTDLGNAWGYLVTQNRSFTAPVWVGEFGTCHSAIDCVQGTSAGSQGLWFQSLSQYLQGTDFDWSYWALDGTQAPGTGRQAGAEELYGVLDTSWSSSALPELTQALQALQPATQGP